MILQGGSALAQRTFTELKEEYKNLNSSQDTCLYIIPDPGDSISQIILIRHGKPLLNKKGKFNSRDARDYAHLYDQVGVNKFDPHKICFINSKIDTVYSSSIRRAENTAELIFRNEEVIISNKVFREFEKEIIPIPFLSLPLDFWLVYARTLWYLRLHHENIESVREAKERSREASSFLRDQSMKDQNVVLVAHGLFNRKLCKDLERNDWIKVYSNGNDYLNIKVLAKKNRPQLGPIE